MIFIDRSIPKAVATALKVVGRSDVKWLEDDFPHDVIDQDWLREVGLRGWLVITRDKKIRSRPGERRALIDNGVGAFCLTQGDTPTRWELLRLVVCSLDEMQVRFNLTPRPFLYGIDRNGRFNQII